MSHFTEQQKDAAALSVCIGGRQDGIAFFGRHPHIGFMVSEELQCELTEAVELLLDYRLNRIRRFACKEDEKCPMCERTEVFLGRNARPISQPENSE